jgi:hypothetical protein
MKIGYSVQGSTDRAFLKGLKQRWCPHASFVEAPFRGSTGLSLRREYRKICEQFVMNGVDIMIFLTDADGDGWREVLRKERESFPPERLHYAIHGVADRNIECWICAEPAWIAQQLGGQAEHFRVEDPKSTFERMLGVDRDSKQEDKISDLVATAPLQAWLAASRSFEDFYEAARTSSRQLGCKMENLRDPA